MSAAVAVPRPSPRKILLVGSDSSVNAVRTSVFKGQGAEVDVALNANEARSLWRPNTYSLILVDVHKQAGEVLDFCREIKGFYRRQRFAFLVGPPRYLSVKWPEQVLEASTRAQWQETVRRLSAAA